MCKNYNSSCIHFVLRQKFILTGARERGTHACGPRIHYSKASALCFQERREREGGGGGKDGKWLMRMQGNKTPNCDHFDPCSHQFSRFSKIAGFLLVAVMFLNFPSL